MELQSARQIIDTLARGIHPVTGEAMPPESPYNEPPVIRALFTVSQALSGKSGKPWAAQDDAALESAFDAGAELKELADKLGRTRFGIEQRLIKLGKIPPATGGGRYGASAAAAA